MKRDHADIFISGGGIAGLIAAASFARAGFSVILTDPAPPPSDAEADGSDLRSTAYLAPARKLLEDVGLWERLSDHAASLDVLRVINCTGDPPEPMTERSFRSTDLGEASFGWNLPNWLTRKLLCDALADMPGVDLRLGIGFARLLTRTNEAIVTLTSGDQVRARLAIAADGRSSPLRDAAGIDCTLTRYGQKALAFVVSHEEPHDNISTELYLSGGAFTLVPLLPLPRR